MFLNAIYVIISLNLIIINECLNLKQSCHVIPHENQVKIILFKSKNNTNNSKL
jgi:hypothetical protein